MRDLRFNDELIVKTIFGNIEVKYIPRYIDNSEVPFGGKPKNIKSHYLAIMIDGSYVGHHKKSIGSRETAVAAVIRNISDHYAREATAQSIKQYED